MLRKRSKDDRSKRYVISAPWIESQSMRSTSLESGLRSPSLRDPKVGRLAYPDSCVSSSYVFCTTVVLSASSLVVCSVSRHGAEQTRPKIHALASSMSVMEA